MLRRTGCSRVKGFSPRLIKPSKVPVLDSFIQFAEQPDVHGNQGRGLNPRCDHLCTMTGKIEGLLQGMFEHQGHPTHGKIEKFQQDQNDHIRKNNKQADANDECRSLGIKTICDPSDQVPGRVQTHVSVGHRFILSC